MRSKEGRERGPESKSVKRDQGEGKRYFFNFSSITSFNLQKTIQVKCYKPHFTYREAEALQAE